MIYDVDFFYSIRNLNEAIFLLEETLFELPNISSVIIKGQFIGTASPFRQVFGNHLFIQKIVNDIHVEQYLILWNRFCKSSITDDTASKLYQSFE